MKEALKEALDAATQIQDECYRAKAFAGLKSLAMSISFLFRSMLSGGRYFRDLHVVVEIISKSRKTSASYL
jgi:hypothetical protein